ncbi:MAG: methionyl-tRNA formyltransferase [Candidatus Sericytochromatia bacterium]|nr:methionyl-tRNA formyltransferase [Candidatus Sericytochromatia bacterium]
MPPRILFMGTPAFAVPTLEAIHAAGWPVVAAICQPDKPVGRGQALTPPAVKVAAERLDIPVLQPAKLRGDAATFEAVRDLQPDVAVVIAYGKLLPASWLTLPPRGCVNLHGSLLPRYRGAAPIQWALIRGETETGVTLMQMDAGMDTGAMLARVTCPITPEDDALSLAARLSHLSAELLVQELPRWLEGALTPEPQDDAQATLAPLLHKETGAIDWRLPATAIVNLARGVQPWPGATARLLGQPLKLRHLRQRPEPAREEPGTVVALTPTGWLVATGDGTVEVGEVQLPGKPMRPAADVARGWRELAIGKVFAPCPVVEHPARA